MLAHTVMATADIWYLAKLGQTELAGAGIAMTGTFTVLCFGIGFLGAVRILIAQAEGAGTLDAYANLPWVAICCAVICGLGAFCLAPQAETVMDWLATPGQVSAFGAQYFRIRMYGALGVFVSIACFGWFDGQGRTKIGMRIMVTANFLTFCSIRFNFWDGTNFSAWCWGQPGQQFALSGFRVGSALPSR